MEKQPVVLVVDDEAFNVDYLFQELEDFGVSTISAENGIEALKQVAAHAPDLVLLDIMMPFLSGWEVLKQLRENALTKDVPVALLTARASPRDDNQQHPTNYCDYITKPFEPEDLLRRVRQILAG